MQSQIQINLKKVLDDINAAAVSCGRNISDVSLLAVSKFHPIEAVLEAINAGQTKFGENRVQEATAKFSEVYKSFLNTELHIIGQLQTNKVKKAVEIASMIESVDRIDLLKEIEKQAVKLNKTINVLMELHTGEESKSGFESVEKLYEALEFCKTSKNIIPCGFMTMAPFTEDEVLIHKSFESLRLASEKLQKDFPEFNLKELSMGMSNDYKIAIQEGSTQVRVGTAIFGQRNY